MNKHLLLTISFLFLSLALFGQKNGNNPSSNGKDDDGRTNLLLPHGNIGINTLDPSERLEVIGNARISDRLFVETIEVTALNVSTIKVREDITVGRHVLVSGNIGIGVQVPSERLDIDGNLKVSQGIFAQSLETNSFLSQNGTFSKSLKVTELFTVDGKTGLGINQPVERLEVDGNVKSTGAFMGQNLQVKEGSITGNIEIGQNLSVTGTATFTGEAAMSSLTVSDNLQSNSFQTSTGSVDGPLAVGGNTVISGNTGLGVAEPVERLEVEGNVKVSNTLFVNTLESTAMSLENGAITNLLTVGGNALIAGNVGIGKDEPSEKLDVNGNIKTSGELMGQSLAVQTGSFTSNVGIGQNLNVTGTSSFTGAVAMDNLQVNSSLQSTAIQAGSGDFSGPISVGGIVSLDSTLFVNGKIGVGTNKIEGYMLSVGGKIRAAGDIRVYPAAEWADYVFADTYRLRPLQEVAAFIEQNHHLPELPSAAEVEKEGVELGAMDALLLQKIEELTLYLLQKEEQIRKLEKRLEALEAESSK